MTVMKSAATVCVCACALVACAASVRTGDQVWQRYEWRASTFSVSAQHHAAVDVSPGGEIVAVWSSRRQQDGRAGVYAQRFSADGVALGSETAVALWSKSHQTLPAVAIDSRGNTWVVWQAHNQDGYAGGIIARRFDADFRGGPEIAVNQEWRGHQARPAVAVSDEGIAVIVWTSTSAGEPQRIRARLFDENGQPASDEFAVSTAADRTEMIPSVAFGGDGSLAVVYSVFDASMKPAGIRMQRFSSAGERLGSEINVSGALRNSQIEPTIAATAKGYVVAWLDGESDGSDYGVLARRFDAAGRPLSDPFVVNTTREGPQNAAAIAVATDGSFAIGWNSSDGDEAGIFAQRFAADGTRIGDELRINDHTGGKQEMHAAAGTQRLVFGPMGDLICVWNGDADLGDGSSVNVTMLSPRALDLAGRRQGVSEEMVPAGPAVAVAGGPKPHEPPTFDPRLIETGEREIRGGRDSGFTGVFNTGWTPPDPHMAVGPNNIVLMTNGAIAFYDKDGTQTFQDEIEDTYGFWGSVGATSFVFDPEVLYDELSGRFFAMAAEAYAPPSSSKSYVLVAVSDDSDPNGTWYKYRFDTSALAGDLFDSPNIGVDEDVVYITGDGFGISSNYPVYAFDKASLLAGNPPAITRSTTLTTSTQSAGIPPVSYDDPPAYYMVEHRENLSSTSVRLIALRDPLGSPYFTTYSLTVPTYRRPANPPQQGTSVRPEMFDARFWSVAYRNGSLWATHHVDSSRVRARWYEIAMNGWPDSGSNPSLVQSGEIDLGSGIYTYFSSITVNECGDAAISAARSGSSEYISMITTYRMSGDALGTFRTPVIQKASDGPYSTDRWGDYSAISADPADTGAFWGHHEYSQSNSWRTWVARIALPPRLGDLNCDCQVDNFDIDAFVLALTSTPPSFPQYYAQYPTCDHMLADCNEDGTVSNFDIDAFVGLLTGG